VTTGGFSSKRLARVRDVLARHLDAALRPITLRDLLTFTLPAFEGRWRRARFDRRRLPRLRLGPARRRYPPRRGVLSRPSVTLMTSDHLTPAQKAVSGFSLGYFDDIGWGFGMSVRTRRPHLGPWPVSYPGNFGAAANGSGSVRHRVLAEIRSRLARDLGGRRGRRSSAPLGQH
jgi:hypothetical protein